MATEGVTGVRVEPLAKVLGVSKGSFYWHFKDRRALLDALLSHWEAQGTEAVIIGVDAAAHAPEDRLWVLMRRVFSTPLELDQFETAVRAWGTRDPSTSQVIARVDRRRLAYVSDILTGAGIPQAEARRRAQVLYSALIGDFFVRSHGGEHLSRATLKSLHALLLSPT